MAFGHTIDPVFDGFRTATLEEAKAHLPTVSEEYLQKGIELNILKVAEGRFLIDSLTSWQEVILGN